MQMSLLSKVSFVVKKKKRDPIKTTGPTAGKAALEQMPVEAAGRCAEPGSGPSHQNRGL